MRRKLRFILPVLLISLFYDSSFCQEVFVGPKLGFSVHKSSFNFKEDEEVFDQKIQAGYQIGGAFELPLENIFSFYTEFYLTQKGKKTIVVENGLENQSRYYFLEAPVFIRLNFEGGTSTAGAIRYHFDLGPTISYWLGGTGTVGIQGFKKYKVVFSNDTSTVAKSGDMIINSANRLQWGFNIGAGMKYPVKKGQDVFVDVRFLFGHSNLVESEGYSTFDLFGYDDDLNVHYRQFIISVSYMFTYDWRLGLKGKSTIRNKKQY